MERACSGDPALLAEVDRLLRAYRTSGSFLDASAVDVALPLLTSMAPLEAGRGLGPWRIVREIGRGGMSRVFEAERADGQFEQRVAIKLLRPGLDSELDLERFRVERQILASFDHPNIARLLDGGVTDDGRGYLVLEHVDGVPIDLHCRENALGIPARLELFLTVAAATQFAHRSLVLHRDLKPGNVLVTREGTVKLLDFGLAKLLDPLPGGEAPRTRTGLRWMTPEYAAPEQILAQPTTTLTDVYQLGVVLYQLLTGKMPFSGREESLHRLEAAILREEPAPPSSVAETGSRKALRGDLDAIVLKAMAKAPEARFTSVQELADDLRRHLSGHPVRARGAAIGYRARRFARRHRVGLAAVGAATTVLAGWVGTVVVQRAQVRAALDEATEAVVRAEQTTDFMMGLFYAAEGGRALADSVSARELLARGETQARQLLGRPALQAHMLDVIGRLYTQLGKYERARPLIEEALETRRRLYGEEHPDVVTSLTSLAAVADLQQDLEEAVALRRRVLDARRRAGMEDVRAVDALYWLAFSLHRARQDSAAWPLFDEWLEARARLPQQASAEGADQLTFAARISEWRGRLPEAEALYREALAVRRELYGGRHPAVATSLHHLGAVLDVAGRSEEADTLLQAAVDMLREAHPGGHPEIAIALRAWAFSIERVGRWPEAVAALREVLDLQWRFIGEGSIDVAVARIDLAVALNATRQHVEAEALARRAAADLERALGDASSMVVLANVHVGDALRGQGRLDEAEPLLLAGHTRFETRTPFNFQWRTATFTALARLRDAQGRPDEARRLRELAGVPTTPPGQP